MPNLPSPLLALTAACLWAAAAPAQELVPLAKVWHERSLENGIRAVVVEAPHSPQQVTFTLLPWGFLAEEAGAVQQSHLVEHLLVHSADPAQVGSQADGLLLNGETMALSQRLESYGPQATWREGLARHGAWLSLDAGSAHARLGPLLEREKVAVLGELDATLQSGATHKWALAAWNQVVRHAARHVPVREGVLSADVGDLLDAIDRRQASGPGVSVVSVGPVPVDEVMAELERVVGSLPKRPWRPLGASLTPAEVSAPGPREATWDLPRVQYMVWYPLPDDEPLDRAAADALAFVLTSRLAQRGGLDQLQVSAYASADLVTPEGRWLLVSAAAPVGVDLARLAALIEETVGGLSAVPEATLLIGDMAAQLGSWPDFGDLRQAMAGRPGLEWIEAQQVLFLLYAQQNMGLDAATLAGVYGRLTAERVAELARQWLQPAKRSTLVLKPRA